MDFALDWKVLHIDVTHFTRYSTSWAVTGDLADLCIGRYCSVSYVKPLLHGDPKTILPGLQEQGWRRWMATSRIRRQITSRRCQIWPDGQPACTHRWGIALAYKCNF